MGAASVRGRGCLAHYRHAQRSIRVMQLRRTVRGAPCTAAALPYDDAMLVAGNSTHPRAAVVARRWQPGTGSRIHWNVQGGAEHKNQTKLHSPSTAAVSFRIS
jgi:hypothetical protein